MKNLTANVACGFQRDAECSYTSQNTTSDYSRLGYCRAVEFCIAADNQCGASDVALDLALKLNRARRRELSKNRKLCGNGRDFVRLPSS